MHKALTALAAVAAMMIAVVAVPNQADAYYRGWGWRGGYGYPAGAVIGGFAAGALLGGLTANRYYGYGPGYYGGPGYYYGSGYYAAPRYYEPYAYEAAPPVYVRPAPRYYRGDYGAQNGCWIATDTTRGYGYYGPC